jgi:hypothetical protein
MQRLHGRPIYGWRVVAAEGGLQTKLVQICGDGLSGRSAVCIMFAVDGTHWHG